MRSIPENGRDTARAERGADVRIDFDNHVGEEAVQHPKGERRDREEVHGGNGLAMVQQERQPTLGNIGNSRRSPHPARDRRFR